MGTSDYSTAPQGVTMTTVRQHDAGQVWDASDVAALWALLADGLTHAEIALRLGRTVAAVRSKLYRLRHP